MKKEKPGLQLGTAVFCGAVTLLFVLFFVYLALFEHASVYEARQEEGYAPVTDYVREELEDPSAPAGVRQVYRWTLDEGGTYGKCLSFYLVHQSARVYLGGELVYELAPAAGGLLTRGVSSNWAMIPLTAGDGGKELRIEITPVYASFVNREVQFLLGSRYAVFVNQLRADLPQLILGGLCMLLGLIIILVQVISILRKRIRSWSMIHLGIFSAMLGLWKLTDTRFSAMMFPGQTLMLGYLAIALLFVAPIPFLLFVRSRYLEHKGLLFTVTVSVIALAALCVLVRQMLGIAELREMLPLAHVLIILTVLLMVWTTLCRNRQRHSAGWVWVLLLAAGVAADVAAYYVRKNSAGIMFTLVAFLIYAAILFGQNTAETNRRAYTDSLTGLFNKSRWDELMAAPTPEGRADGILMMDLNSLKKINDTQGHEAGDRLIVAFANILRNSIPASYTICRWGGDEFAVLITDATREKLDRCLCAVASGVGACRQSGEQPELYYAAGWALSSDWPGLTRQELFRKADQEMYHNKQQWYQENARACRTEKS